MKLNDHPNYAQYKDEIKQILAITQSEPYEHKSNASPLPPSLLQEKFFTKNHQNNQHLIGLKRDRVTILGFLKPEINNSDSVKFACQCNCGLYCSISLKRAHQKNEETLVSCQKCLDTISKFNKAFIKKTGEALSHEAINAIVFPELELEVPTLMRPIDINEVSKVREQKIQALAEYSTDDLKWLLLPNNKLNDKFFILSKEDNKVYKRDGLKNLSACSLEPVKMINLWDDQDIPRTFKQSMHKKIFRLTVIGITTNDKEYNTRNLTYVCKCDCGLYTSKSHANLKPQDLPACGRCEAVNKMLVRKERFINNNIITTEQAWQLLGQNTQIVPSQIEDLKAIKNNSYETPRKVYEKDSSFSKFQEVFDKRFGLVTAIAKSRRLRTKDSYYQIACKCDCGNECVFSFNTLRNLEDPHFLACSACTTIIQSATNINIFGRTERFTQKWNEFLEYREIKDKLSFVEVYQHFLKVRYQNPNIIFSYYLTKLFDHLNNKSKVFCKNDLSNHS